ncbi:hypothetical protein SD77_0473 [Bacillus badius]|uniref:Mobile element protein n=1 Tax=Bacillus badius TaxID=1455 RepID=A0ABR5B180_BACBA|nr:hypothetical protein SD77_0473 [Bacillus badius]
MQSYIVEFIYLVYFSPKNTGYSYTLHFLLELNPNHFSPNKKAGTNPAF